MADDYIFRWLQKNIVALAGDLVFLLVRKVLPVLVRAFAYTLEAAKQYKICRKYWAVKQA